MSFLINFEKFQPVKAENLMIFLVAILNFFATLHKIIFLANVPQKTYLLLGLV